MNSYNYDVEQENEILKERSRRRTERITVDLDKLSVSEIKRWIRTPIDYQKKKLFIEGDHWQGGTGWVGPLPPRDQPTERIDALERIRKAFTSQNACLEVVERHVDAVSGNDPLWSYSGEEELNAILMQWWKSFKLHGLLQKTLEMAKWADRAFLRRVVPPDRVQDVLIDTITGTVYTERDLDSMDVQDVENLEPAQVILSVPFEEAVKMIHIELIEPTHGTVVQDSETLQLFGCYVYKVGRTEQAEVSYVDQEGLTHLLIVKGNAVVSDVALDMGGYLLHHEVELTSLITEQVMQLQKMLNKAYTMGSTNMDWGGFTERVFLNAQWPYKIETDENGQKRRIPIDYQTGPATTNWVVGVTMEDPTTGRKTLTQPEVKWRQPSDPTVFDKAKMMAYRGILQEVRQLHALITGEATTTGESRKQALVEFNKSLEPTKTEADNAGEWIIDGQVRFANAISSEAIVVESTLMFQTIIEVGPIDANEVRLWDEVRQKGGVTLKTFLSKMGVEDVEAEMHAVQEDPVYQANLMSARLDQLRKVMDLNFDILTAARLLKFTDEEIEILQSANVLQDTDIDL